MADINKIIGVSIDDNASGGLSKIDKGLTKVTQSTKTFTKETNINTEAVVQNGGAMGLLNELTGGLAMTFKDASEAIGMTGASLKSLKGILLATGIGALVVIMGELISNWDKWSKVISGSADEIENLSNKMAELNLQRERYLQSSNTEIQLLEINGASSRRILQEKYAQNAELIKQQEEELALAEKNYRIEFGDDRNSKETLDALKARNEAQGKLNDLKNNALILEAQFNKLEKDTAIQKKKNLDEQTLKTKKLREEEQQRYLQLIKIRQEIEKTIDSQVLMNSSFGTNKEALALNGQYAELLKLYDVRNKLVEQQKQAIELANKNGEVSQKEQEELDAINKLLIKQNNIIQNTIQLNRQNGKNSNFSNENLELIRLNGEAELMMIQGFTYDALKLKREAFEVERKLREQNLEETVKANKRSLDSAQEALAREKFGTEEYGKALAIKNDLDKQYNNNKKLLDDERLNNEFTSNAFALDIHSEYIATKQAIDEEYYNKISIVAANFQGFLGVLQDENIIRSKDLRNVLLVTEKSIAVVGVIVNTLKENRELSAMSIKETAAATAAFARYDFAAGSLHAAAAGKATAGIGLNTAAAGVTIASIVATTAASWNKNSGGGGAGGAGGGGNPQAQFNMIQSSGTNQLAATIASKQNQPVNAYVVGSDVATENALTRNRITTATFL